MRWPTEFTVGLLACLAAGCAPPSVVDRTAPASVEAGVPSFSAVRAAYQPSDVQLLDRTGAVVHELRVDPSRRRLAWVPLAEISPALQAAVIAAEDRRFYQHHGVDGWAVVAAAARQLTGRGQRGASTISMQLATLIEGRRAPRGGRTLAQKWRQMRAAWAIEARWSKSEILEAYLNLVTFRGELQGVAAAAGVLYGKKAHGLTEPESLVLAALLKSPNAAPAAVGRRAAFLHRVLHGTADGCDIGGALTRAMDAPAAAVPRVTQAPHAAHRLLRAVPPFASVRSTLDAETQRAAAAILHDQLLALRGRRVRDGALLVVENASGDVVAYVGGSGDLSRAPQVDGVRAPRQAGSALKPFLYALAVEQRLLTPASLI
jgi:penicillin-binding protein 1C